MIPLEYTEALPFENGIVRVWDSQKETKTKINGNLVISQFPEAAATLIGKIESFILVGLKVFDGHEVSFKLKLPKISIPPGYKRSEDLFGAIAELF